MNVSCKPVCVVIRYHGRRELQELILEHNLAAVSVEDYVFRAFADDLELKAGLVAPFEQQITFALRCTGVLSRLWRIVLRQEILGTVLRCQMLGKHANRETLCTLILDYQRQLCNVIAVR